MQDYAHELEDRRVVRGSETRTGRRPSLQCDDENEEDYTPTKNLACGPALRDEFPMAELQDFKGFVALVVSSCDAFFDAWKPFNAFLR